MPYLQGLVQWEKGSQKKACGVASVQGSAQKGCALGVSLPGFEPQLCLFQTE